MFFALASLSRLHNEIASLSELYWNAFRYFHYDVNCRSLRKRTFSGLFCLFQNWTVRHAPRCFDTYVTVKAQSLVNPSFNQSGLVKVPSRLSLRTFTKQLW
ncbi:hypothetical protein NPIL_547771 [Nephila pilipes]|uniref:Uncharacterized protein n=1 Tax=Nephila pilipes TaxID=299642 RepID=A0A8X6U603_NEPPI|nr:hypothetical protein NPIL_547771 [Nephila pilipes]